MNDLRPDILEFYALHRGIWEPYNLAGLFEAIQEHEHVVQLFEDYPPGSGNSNSPTRRKTLSVDMSLTTAINAEILNAEHFFKDHPRRGPTKSESIQFILWRLTENTQDLLKTLYRERIDQRLHININEPLSRTMHYGPLGRALLEYQKFREIFEPFISKQWSDVPPELKPVIEEAWRKFVEARKAVKEDRHDSLHYFLAPTYVVPYYTALMASDYAFLGSNFPLIEEGIRKLKDAERFIKKPLLFWNKIHEAILFFASPPLPEKQSGAAAVISGGKIETSEQLTPARTRAQHAEAWGYDSAKSAARIFKAVWNSGKPNNAAIRALNIETLFPLIQQFRTNKAKPGWNWKVPKTPKDILDMYENSTAWEQRT